MKPADIVVGKTYANRGAGRTKRVVLAIGMEHRPKVWYGAPEKEPNEPGVLYSPAARPSVQCNLYLSTFAQWAGREC